MEKGGSCLICPKGSPPIKGPGDPLVPREGRSSSQRSQWPTPQLPSLCREARLLAGNQLPGTIAAAAPRTHEGHLEWVDPASLPRVGSGLARISFEIYRRGGDTFICSPPPLWDLGLSFLKRRRKASFPKVPILASGCCMICLTARVCILMSKNLNQLSLESLPALVPQNREGFLGGEGATLLSAGRAASGCGVKRLQSCHCRGTGPLSGQPPQAASLWSS